MRYLRLRLELSGSGVTGLTRVRRASAASPRVLGLAPLSRR